MSEQELKEAVREVIQEHSAYPQTCPWCGYSGMLSHHMAKKHPDKYIEWKENHKKVNINRTVWVDKDD